jgi:hypothetical protein
MSIGQQPGGFQFTTALGTTPTVGGFSNGNFNAPVLNGGFGFPNQFLPLSFSFGPAASSFFINQQLALTSGQTVPINFGPIPTNLGLPPLLLPNFGGTGGLSTGGVDTGINSGNINGLNGLNSLNGGSGLNSSLAGIIGGLLGGTGGTNALAGLGNILGGTGGTNILGTGNFLGSNLGTPGFNTTGIPSSPSFGILGGIA